MRIGIDCRTILNPSRGERAGVGHYTYYLVKSLLALDRTNQYVLFFDYRTTDTREFEQGNVTIRRFPFSQYKKFLPFSYSHLLIAAFLGRAKLDLYHSPANVVPYTYTAPSVITVHDLAIYKNRKWFPPRQAFSTRVLVPRSLKIARRIIAVSQATKRDIVKLFRVPEKKVTVIAEGMAVEQPKVSRATLAKQYRLPGRYILYVGTLEPRKNIKGLLEAFASLKKGGRHRDVHLVLAGGKGYRHEEVFKTINRLGLNRTAHYLGYVPHDHKLGLIAGAAAFVFPTFYEGFGLPVLEAMSLGTPVISSNVSSIPEVADRAALLVNPTNTEALAEAIGRVLGQPKLAADLSRRGRIQAKRFTWSAVARQTLDLYRAMASERKVQQGKKKKKKR